jgi:hypothetical protein
LRDADFFSYREPICKIETAPDGATRAFPPALAPAMLAPANRKGADMTISRRTFLASLLAAGASAALPAGAAPRPRIRLSGPVFTRALATEADFDWLRDCVMHSCWQIDRDGFDGRALVRHTMTGLVYAVAPLRGFGVRVRQVAAECCPCREDLDPDYVVGHAARRVAAIALVEAAQGRENAVYLRFPWGGDEPEWPATPAPQFEAAPRIVLKAAGEAPGV